MNSKGISFPCSSWCKKPVLFPWFSTKAKNPLPKARNHLAFTERGDCILRRKSLETDVVDNEQTRSHRDAAARPETALGSNMQGNTSLQQGHGIASGHGLPRQALDSLSVPELHVSKGMVANLGIIRK